MTTTTEGVREFYERMPYPPPLTNLDRERDLYREPDVRRARCSIRCGRQSRNVFDASDW